MSKKNSYIRMCKKLLDKKCSTSSKPSASHYLFAGGGTQTEAAGRESHEMLQVWIQYRTLQELKLCPIALRYSMITISNVCPIHSFIHTYVMSDYQGPVPPLC